MLDDFLRVSSGRPDDPVEEVARKIYLKGIKSFTRSKHKWFGPFICGWILLDGLVVDWLERRGGTFGE